MIEVSDSSLRYDRTTKLRLYAEAAIPEYWIVDCEGGAVEVYRAPEGSGYRDFTGAAGADSTRTARRREEWSLPRRIFYGVR